jgi:mannose-1-phosphate guanylyltransferase
LNAVVLAGGYGTRLRPLTNKIPKPAIIVKGKPIIRHVLDWLENVGFDDIIVKTHYLPEKIKEAVGEDRNVVYINERKLTPTAYFLRKHKDYLEDEFLITNGDTLTNLDLLDFIEFHMINKNIATVFTHDDAIHTSGTYIFDKDILTYIKRDMDIPHLMAVLVEADIPINLYKSDIPYFDTADHAKLEKARRMWKLE